MDWQITRVTDRNIGSFILTWCTDLFVGKESYFYVASDNCECWWRWFAHREILR